VPFTDVSICPVELTATNRPSPKVSAVHVPDGPDTAVQVWPFVDAISSGRAFAAESATYRPFPYATDCHDPAGIGYSVQVAPSDETAASAV
jgi:hypothetical protein